MVQNCSMEIEWDTWDTWEVTPSAGGGAGDSSLHSAFGLGTLGSAMSAHDRFKQPPTCNQLDQPMKVDDPMTRMDDLISNWDAWDAWAADPRKVQGGNGESSRDSGCEGFTFDTVKSSEDGFDDPLPINQDIVDISAPVLQGSSASTDAIQDFFNSRPQVRQPSQAHHVLTGKAAQVASPADSAAKASSSFSKAGMPTRPLPTLVQPSDAGSLAEVDQSSNKWPPTPPPDKSNTKWAQSNKLDQSNNQWPLTPPPPDKSNAKWAQSNKWDQSNNNWDQSNNKWETWVDQSNKWDQSNKLDESNEWEQSKKWDQSDKLEQGSSNKWEHLNNKWTQSNKWDNSHKWGQSNSKWDQSNKWDTSTPDAMSESSDLGDAGGSPDPVVGASDKLEHPNNNWDQSHRWDQSNSKWHQSDKWDTSTFDAEDAMSESSDLGDAGGRKLGSSKSCNKAPHIGEAECKVWIGGLPDNGKYDEGLNKKLMEHMAQGGDCKHAEIRKGGMGEALYKTPEEAQAAVMALNGSAFMGHTLELDVWVTTTQAQKKWDTWASTGKTVPRHTWESAPRDAPSAIGDDSYDSVWGDDYHESGCEGSDADSAMKAPELSDKLLLSEKSGQNESKAGGKGRSQRAAPRMRGSVAKETVPSQPASSSTAQPHSTSQEVTRLPAYETASVYSASRMKAAASSDLQSVPAAKPRITDKAASGVTQEVESRMRTVASSNPQSISAELSRIADETESRASQEVRCRMRTSESSDMHPMSADLSRIADKSELGASQEVKSRMKTSASFDLYSTPNARRGITENNALGATQEVKSRRRTAESSDLHSIRASRPRIGEKIASGDSEEVKSRIRTPRGSVSRCAQQPVPEPEGQSCPESLPLFNNGPVSEFHRHSVLVVGDSGLGLRRASKGSADFKKELQAKLMDMDVEIERFAGAGVRAILDCLQKQKNLDIVVAVWFLNEFFEKNRLSSMYPPLMDELAGDLADALRKIPRCVAVIGGSAELWGVDVRFDRWAQNVRDILSSAGIFVVDGVDLFCRIDEAGGRKDEWHARNSDSNKECMATYFADLVRRILAQ